MKPHGVAVLAGPMSLLLAACASPAADPNAAGPAASGAVSGKDKPTVQRSKAAPRTKLPTLGPGERRVAVIVLPGDASVEVDGQPAWRRDGVVELAGKVGDVHRVRVFKGPKHTAETLVTIEETGASPSRLDLNEASAAGPAKVTAKPARFGFDE